MLKNWLASIPPIPLYKQLLVLLLLALLTFLVYLSLKAWKRLDELELKDRFAARNEFIKTTAQILGGAFFLFGLYFTWSNLVATQEKNITDLYTKGVEQLGSDRLEVRLGGIYALERIARESEKDHWPIMEVLTAYVRENAPWPPEPLAEARKKRPWAKSKEQGPSPPEQGKPEKQETINFKPDPDIQAVLTVIGRRARTYLNGEKQVLDLREADLRGADFRQAHLEGANLRLAHLEGAGLRRAHLEGAFLSEAHLEGAYLGKAHLEGATLVQAHLEGANLWEAHLEEAFLGGTHLEGAFLSEAHLEGAILEGATGLTQEQLANAITDKNTELPDYLKQPQPEKPESK